MIIRKDLCVGCAACLDICPGDAIYLSEGNEDGASRTAAVDRDLCVECSVCLRWDGCPTAAFREEDLSWPRSVRRMFSDPVTTFEETTVSGRGTEEMKTNDITGRFVPGQYGLSVDVGRPNMGTRLKDVDKITRALAAAGAKFSRDNPLMSLMIDAQCGRLSPEVLDERVLSAVVECIVTPADLPRALRCVQEVAGEIDTVFSVGLITEVTTLRDEEELYGLLDECDVQPKNSAKINVGLGRADDCVGE